MLPKPPVVIVLALLLTGCGSTTRPSALPEPVPVVAPKADAPVPATPEDVLAHVRDYGQYCRKLEAGYRALADYAENAHD